MMSRTPTKFLLLRKRLNAIRLGERKQPEMSHCDMLVAMIGQLCLGKSDYADIES